MANISLTSRLCQGARLLRPTTGHSPSSFKGRHVALVINDESRSNDVSATTINDSMNSLSAQFSSLRLSSSFASSSFASSSSASFHSSPALDGVKLKVLKQKARPAIRPLEELPEKPKHPQNSWFEFCSVNRPVVKRAQPSLTQTEIMKVCSEMWKRVSPTEKEKYEARSRRRRYEFETAMKRWKDETTEDERNALELFKKEEKKSRVKGENEAKQKKERKLLLEELGKPKKPFTTFFRFMQEQRELRKKTGMADGMQQKEFLALVVEKYKKLPQSEMTRLKNLFDDDKKSYEVAIENWNKKMAKDGKVTDVGRR